MSNLKQDNLYLLKWSSVKNGQITNMVVLKGQFINYFNNKYCEQFKNYKDNEEDDGNTLQPPTELVGTIFTEEGDYVIYPFDDPLYPYSRFFKRKLPVGTGCNLGLFRIISIENSIATGIKKPFDIYRYLTFYFDAVINTPNIISGETLMWVDLDKVAIREPIDKLKALQNRALDTFGLPDDMNYTIKKYLGGKKTQKKKIKRNKKKKKITQKRRGFKYLRV